jgi:hypothetical protein
MATTSQTTYTHTCDLCGTGAERKELRRFGLTDIAESAYGSSSDLRLRDKRTCDVCPACQSRPIADVLAVLDPPSTGDELSDLRRLANVHT